MAGTDVCAVDGEAGNDLAERVGQLMPRIVAVAALPPEQR